MSSITVHPVLEARFRLDGGAMFGIIPKPLWERTNPADDANRIDLGTRCMLIRHPTAGNILVDVGIGDKWDDKGRGIYDIRHTDEREGGAALGLAAGLGVHGLSLDDIDHVILTHLHFDHAGGATVVRDGVLEPTFPGRPHYVMRQQWEWAQRPSERDAGSFRREDFGVFEDRPDVAPLTLLDGITELFPGVTLWPRHGHTPAMACVLVDTDHARYVHLADLIPTSGHVRIPYVMGYDLDPMTTCREKREVLSETARHDWVLFFEHDPIRATCRVEPDGRGQWRISE